MKPIKIEETNYEGYVVELTDSNHENGQSYFCEVSGDLITNDIREADFFKSKDEAEWQASEFILDFPLCKVIYVKVEDKVSFFRG